MNLDSLKQSDNWFKYLHFLGWEHETTSNGTKVAFMKTFMGYVTKIQRPKNFSEKDLEEIEQLCEKYNTQFIKMEAFSKEHEPILKDNGFVRSYHPLCPPSTLVIDLKKSKESLWADVSRSGKYKIKRAKREGSSVSITPAPRKAQMTQFYKVLTETRKLKKFYVQPIEDIYKLAEIYKDQCFVAEVRDQKNKLMGSKFFLAENKTITFIMGGTTKAGRKGLWGYDLLWESILYFKDIKYLYLDLEGIDDPRFPKFTSDWGGFSHFKEKFGGELVRFPPPYIKYRSNFLKILSKLMTLPL